MNLATLDLMRVMAAVTGFLVGPTLGSFAGMAGYRWVRGQDWLDRSLCDGCGMVLDAGDMVPVAGWLWRGGKCACRQVRINALYPILEFICAVACAVAGWKFGFSPEFLLLCLLVTVLAIIVTVDLEVQLIPDRANAALFLLGLGWMVVRHQAQPQQDYRWQLGASAVLFLIALFLATIYSRLRGKAVLGGGDVKFMAGAGLWVSIWSLNWFLVLSGVIGLIFGLIWKARGRGHEFPFAPALALALYITVLFG